VSLVFGQDGAQLCWITIQDNVGTRRLTREHPPSQPSYPPVKPKREYLTMSIPGWK